MGRAATSPPRVVHVAGGTRTGCTRVVLDLLRLHDRTRIDPAACFFSIAPADPAVVAAVDALGLPSRDVVKRGRYEAAAIARLASALRELRADVAVLHGFGAYSFGAPAAALARIPVRVRVEHSPELYGRAHRAASAFTARLVHSTVLVSAHLGDYLRAAGTRPPAPEVIHNGVDVEAFAAAHRPPFEPAAGGAPREPVALMAGRLDVAKDHDTLLDAMALLRRRGVALRLRLAGAGPFEGRLRERARALGIGDRVEFLGWRDDLVSLLDDADVAVLATRYEGFGLAVVEAMAAGRPVVASRVAAVPELVDDGREGLLVPPGDAGALADALGALVADPARARALGEAGRARARREFAVEAAVRAFERHVLRTVAARG